MSILGRQNRRLLGGLRSTAAKKESARERQREHVSIIDSSTLQEAADALEAVTPTIGGIARLPGKSPRRILTPSKYCQTSSPMFSFDVGAWGHRRKALDNRKVTYSRKTSVAQKAPSQMPASRRAKQMATDDSKVRARELQK